MRTDMTKPIVAFRNFANAPKIVAEQNGYHVINTVNNGRRSQGRVRL